MAGGRIREEDVELVRERADIVKVVGEYLSLKKAGHDSLVGLCPFHTEKSPSFSVSPSKQVYYCFGCQAGGDVVRFVQEMEHLSFPETVETLARGIGYTLRYEGDDPSSRKAASRRQGLFAVNEEAARLFQESLLGEGGAEARGYLDQRGISRESIDTFEIGFAPVQADYLLRKLANKVSADLLVEAGLASKDASGGIRDRFRSRITFPIADLAGRHVGFGARILPSSEAPAKYINTAETPVYRKGHLLYNLHRAKTAAGRSGEVFVVEGYTDVVALAQAGIGNAVATCGTALTEEHVKLLSRFATRAVLMFDGDEAGARAAERAYAFHESTRVELVVLIIPDGRDPADFVTAEGAAAFGELAAGAKPLVEYMLRRVADRADHSSIEGRSRAVNEGLPLVQGLTDPVRRQQYAHRLADLAGVDDGAVMSLLGTGPPAPGVTSRGNRSKPAPAKVDAGSTPRLTADLRVEREMLKMLAQSRDAWIAHAPTLTPEHFSSDDHRAAFARLQEVDGDVRRLVAESSSGTDEAGGEMEASHVSEGAPSGSRHAVLLSLAVDPPEGDGSDYATVVRQRLEELRLRRLRDDARLQLERLNPVTDPTYDELFKQLIDLDAQLRSVKDGLSPTV